MSAFSLCHVQLLTRHAEVDDAHAAEAARTARAARSRALALRTWPDETAAQAEFNAALALQSLGGPRNVDAAKAAPGNLRNSVSDSSKAALDGAQDQAKQELEEAKRKARGDF